MSKSLLDRLLDAEERADNLQRRVNDLESRLRGALRADPTTASRALSWVSRAEQAEQLLAELLRFIDQRAVDTSKFPAGWIMRAASQMKSVEILRRDQEEMAERPESGDYWTTYVDSLGRRGIARDAAGRLHRT